MEIYQDYLQKEMNVTKKQIMKESEESMRLTG